jgi:hypothetical protein
MAAPGGSEQLTLAGASRSATPLLAAVNCICALAPGATTTLLGMNTGDVRCAPNTPVQLMVRSAAVLLLKNRWSRLVGLKKSPAKV